MSASEDEQIALGGGADGASRPPPAGRDDVLAVLAPMAGYTDAAFRLLCRRRGCARTYTEVVNAEGIARGSRPTLYLLETLPDERPVVAHIYGRDPSVMAAAAVYIESLRRFDQVDVNTGCPVRKIVAKGCGAALMREPERVHEIVRAIVSAVSLPVTVKTRLGPTREELCVSEIAQAAEEGGAAEIAIHARTTAQKHGGEADWRTLARVKAERRIAVLGNGGVATAADALRMIRETGVDGVMIGRAALSDPWLLAELDPDGARDRAAVARTMVAYMRRPGVEARAVARHMTGLFRGRPGARAWRIALSAPDVTPDAVARALEGMG